MAVVRRSIGRAQVPGALTPPAVPHQSGPSDGFGPSGSAGPSGPTGPTLPAATGAGAPVEVAAAAPSMPAKGWAVLTGLGLAGAGGLGAWNIGQLASPSVFQVGNQMSTFAALFVFAAAVERLLEPFTRWMPGRTEQAQYEKAVADADNGVPDAMTAAAHYKAAWDQGRASRGMIMWGLATGLSTILSAGGGFYLLRLISANPSWNGVPTWVDALVTGLVVGSGTKPLHDVISRIQRPTSV
jgi:hypothetical protein